MSQKSQVKKVLPFTVLPKWRIGSSLTRSCIFKESLRVVLALLTSGSIGWCLFVSFLFLVVWRGVSIDLGDILGCQSCLGVFKGVFGDSLREGSSQTGANWPFWTNPERQDFFSPGTVETLKYQNLPICHFQKWPSFAIFLIFCVCHKEITIYSLFGSLKPIRLMPYVLQTTSTMETTIRNTMTMGTITKEKQVNILQQQEHFKNKAFQV